MKNLQNTNSATGKDLILLELFWLAEFQGIISHTLAPPAFQVDQKKSEKNSFLLKNAQQF